MKPRQVKSKKPIRQFIGVLTMFMNEIDTYPIRKKDHVTHGEFQRVSGLKSDRLRVELTLIPKRYRKIGEPFVRNRDNVIPSFEISLHDTWTNFNDELLDQIRKIRSHATV